MVNTNVYDLQCFDFVQYLILKSHAFVILQQWRLFMNEVTSSSSYESLMNQLYKNFPVPESTLHAETHSRVLVEFHCAWIVPISQHPTISCMEYVDFFLLQAWKFSTKCRSQKDNYWIIRANLKFRYWLWVVYESFILGPIYEKGQESMSKPLAMSVTKFRLKRVFGNFARL